MARRGRRVMVARSGEDKARLHPVGGDKKLGVGQALARAGLTFRGTPHRGVDDARNIARLLPYCLGRTPLPPR